jgi:hypothetical protein
MDGLTGFAAVVMVFAIPLTAIVMYTFYRVRRLRTDERLAAIQRGVSVPMEAELAEHARSCRNFACGRSRGLHAGVQHRRAL